jgi:serine phosphatase RsbU (regulator of sigma subunit)
MILKEKEARLRNIALTRNFIILFVIFLLIVVIIILRNYNTIKKQKIEIEIKNKSIQDGINYAQRIQKALFAAQEEFLSLFPDSFILFMPRDVVSGDFLWFSSANLKSVLSRDGFNEIKDNKDNNKYIISAVDCTGHGVPGAMMSMIGYKLIYEIISSGIVSPEKILFYLHKGLINQFRQDDKSEIQDGMDLALCTIDLSSKIIEYSGAKNPLIYIKDGKLNKIKGDNFSTGGKMSVDDERIFTKHTIKVDSPTYIYMFSDGYIDQLGGVNGRKFLLKNLETLLFKIYNKPFSEQYKLLVDALKNWQGEHKQVDDILIVGFKIS